MPSPYTSRVRIKVKTDGTYGVAGFPIDAVSTDYRTLTIRYLIASPPLANFNPVGRAISVIGRQTGATPFLSATITSYDPATGECGITGNGILGTSSTNPAYVFQPGDVCVLRYKADPLTITPTSVTDSSMMSPEYPSGWAVGAQVGQLIRVIAGTSRGQIRKVVANTATQLTWDLPMVLDETSVWIMEPPAWSYVADSAAIQNADYDQASLMHIPVTNYSHRCILVAPFTVDIYGGESADGDEIVRELYIFGEPGTSSGGGTVEGYYNIPIASGHATPDLSRGLNQEVILNTAPVAIDAPTNSRQVTWSLILAQDSTGGRAVTFDSAYIGADALPGMLNTAPSTYSSLDFIVQPDGKCALSNIVSGVPLV
jgi:hypothetical protein